MQGFSLFKVVIQCDVTSNTMLFLLEIQGYSYLFYFLFQNQKKKKN